MSTLSFLVTSSLNSVSDSWLPLFYLSLSVRLSPSLHLGIVSLSFHCLWESSFLPLLLKLLCSVPCIYGVNFCGKIPVSFSVTVYLISWSYWSWAVVHVGSVYVFGFWFFWVFLGWVFPTSWLSEGQSVPHLLFSVVQVWAGCVGAGSSICTSFWGFSVGLVQSFVFSNFFTI